MLPNKSGYLIPERDVDALAQRLEFLVENSHLWPALGRAGHEYAVANYDIHMLNVKLLNLYNEAIGRPPTCLNPASNCPLRNGPG
jgi:colanic acid/amylovoran biosynthesis glycosyltransferase